MRNLLYFIAIMLLLFWAPGAFDWRTDVVACMLLVMAGMAVMSRKTSRKNI